MSDITIAAVLRAGVFSPNHIAQDAAILHAVVAELRKRGCQVSVYSEEEFCEADIFDGVILSMGRTDATLMKLQRLEDQGRLVINSGYGIENCTRMIALGFLKKAQVPMPESLIVETDVDVRRRLRDAGFGACWVKKGDAPVHHLEDIARCRYPEETQELLHEFFFRGIRKAVVSRDVVGEKVRCYGVASSGWFHAYCPLRSADSDGSDQMSGEQAEPLREICMNAASVLGVDVFGCDVIVDAEGKCWLVNFDDWPSFAPIRKEAARAIAKAVLARARKTASANKRKSV